MSPAKQLLFGECSVVLVTEDLLRADVAVVVNATDRELSHGAHLSQRLLAQAGAGLAAECAQLMREYGHFELGMALQTSAGNMPYQAIIHAVVVGQDSAWVQQDIERAVSRSLLICETNDWGTIAFPPLGVATGELALDACAQAMQRAITRYWDARLESAVQRIVVCLEEHQFSEFCAAFERAGAIAGPADSPSLVADAPAERATAAPVGYIELDGDDASAADDAIDDWFK